MYGRSQPDRRDHDEPGVECARCHAEGGVLTIETSKTEFSVQAAAAIGRPLRCGQRDRHRRRLRQRNAQPCSSPSSRPRQSRRRRAGLSAVYGMIEQNDGFVRVSSQPARAPGSISACRGYRTCRSWKGAVAEAMGIGGVRRSGGGGRGRVLRLIAETLRVYGYKVVETTDSSERWRWPGASGPEWTCCSPTS